ncbi:MAG: type VI secretion system baseplate subunit TssG [Desulfamplus sp.]|nr:type VI secretion system baseplate subunit TssG [Desulfamplus sp.]
MAIKKRDPGTDVDIENLFKTDNCYTWNFFLLLRYIDSLQNNKANNKVNNKANNKDKTNSHKIGYTQHPADDLVRFVQEATLTFPPTQVAKFHPEKMGMPPKLSVFCFGLLGCNGPMPLHFTEYIFKRVRHHKDNTLKNFIDMFHHRMISMYYRSWAVSQQAVSFESNDDPIGEYIGSLIGRGTENSNRLDIVPRTARLYYSGRLMHPTMNAEGLCAILSDYFGVAAHIEQYVGQWLTIPEENRWYIGKSKHTGSLGQNCVVGKRVWDCQHKFRVVLGPMKRFTYNRLVPGNTGFDLLKAWIKSYVGLLFDWEVQLVLLADEVPELKPNKTIQLGYTSWLRNKKHKDDAGDLLLKSHIH